MTFYRRLIPQLGKFEALTYVSVMITALLLTSHNLHLQGSNMKFEYVCSSVLSSNSHHSTWRHTPADGNCNILTSLFNAL